MENKKIPDKLYFKILENMPICCVDLIIAQDSKVLLVKRANEPEKNLWGLVGGRIFKKESLLNAAKRKAVEEIGVEIDVGKMVCISETIFNTGSYKNLKTGVHTMNITFLAKLKNPKSIKIDKSILEYKWFDKIDNEIAEYVKKVLKDTNVFN